MAAGLFSGTIQAGSEVLSSLPNPRNLYNIYREKPSDIAQRVEKEFKYGVKDKEIRDLAMEKGLKGSWAEQGKVINKALQKEYPVIENMALKGKNPVSINTEAYKGLLNDFIEGRGGNIEFDKQAQQAKKLIDDISYFEGINKYGKGKLPQSLTLEMRSFLDDIRNQTSFKINPTLSPKQEVYKTAADTARSALAKANPKLANKLKSYSDWYKLWNSVKMGIIQERKIPINMQTDDMLATIIGSGFSQENPVKGGIVGLGLEKLREMSLMPNVRTNIAQSSQKIVPAIKKAEVPIRLGITKSFGNQE